MSKKYYRAIEVANYLGISLSGTWSMAKKRIITPIKLSPRVTVFDIEEIQNLLISKK